MGGPGSGRWFSSYSRRWTVEQMARVDVRVLHRRDPFPQDQKKIWLSVKGEQGECELRIDWTGCNFGQGRPWFVCPHCGSRCAILYRPPRAPLKELACRKCYNLTYQSRRKRQPWNTERLRVQRIERRLGVKRKPALVNLLPPRPKGMHHKTYERLAWEWREAMLAWDAVACLHVQALAARMNKLLGD